MRWDKGNQRDLERLRVILCTRHYARHFTRICSFNVYNSPERLVWRFLLFS